MCSPVQTKMQSLLKKQEKYFFLLLFLAQPVVLFIIHYWMLRTLGHGDTHGGMRPMLLGMHSQPDSLCACIQPPAWDRGKTGEWAPENPFWGGSGRKMTRGRTTCELRLQVPVRVLLFHWTSFAKHKFKNKVIKNSRWWSQSIEPQLWDTLLSGGLCAPALVVHLGSWPWQYLAHRVAVKK